jgi:TonB family protein
MAATVTQNPGRTERYANRLVVIQIAAYLLRDDRQAVRTPAALLLAGALLGIATPWTGARATAWQACNAPGLVAAVATAQPSPPYPESARQAGAEGFVELSFVVLRDGRVGWIRIVKAQPSGFFESAALEGVRDWRFRPALRDNEPVECRIQTRVRFTLADTVAARPAGAPLATQDPDQPAPVYPEAARLQGLEGYVEVSFQVGPDGRVSGAEVLTAMPRGDFEKTALEAVRRWRFPAAPGEPRRMTRRFDFTLPDSYPHAPAPTLIAAAPFPAEACARRVAGLVKLEAEVDADGRITSARVLEARPAGLYDGTALAMARNSRLAPAYRGGVAIPATALFTLRFEPDAAHCPGADTDDPRNPRQRSSPSPKVSATPGFPL